MKNQTRADCFRGKNVLITGGLGFIGSNLAIEMVNMGARVSLLDAMIDGHGGNLFNIKPIKRKVTVNFKDVRDERFINSIVRGKDYIFHLAGQNDHVLSLTNPFPDIDINIKGSAVLLEACKKHNKDVKLVYTGTRGEYGCATKLPVDENAPINPRGIYELSSLTVQKMFKIYNDNHGVRSVMLRLTNIYGERAQMRHSRFGVANWFMRLALDDGTIKIFGDGSILRDFLYVQDTVDAILICAQCEDAYGNLFNVGNDKPSSFLNLAKMIIKIAGRGRWEFAPFSPERLVQEPGDFYSDIGKIRKVTGWSPRTNLRSGLENAIGYYKKHKKHYW